MNASFFGQFSSINGLGHGGDAGVPDWVPMGAFGYIDFVDGHYWNGTASVGIGDVIGDDTDGATGDPFAPSQVIAGRGYVGNSDIQTAGQIIGSLRPALTAGSSIVMEYEVTDAASFALDSWVYSDDFSVFVTATVTNVHDSAVNYADANTFAFDDTLVGDHTLGVHKIAFTISDGHWVIVWDGGDPVVSAVTLGGGPITGMSLEIQTGLTLRKITSYDPASDAALQALTA